MTQTSMSHDGSPTSFRSAILACWTTLPRRRIVCRGVADVTGDDTDRCGPGRDVEEAEVVGLALTVDVHHHVVPDGTRRSSARGGTSRRYRSRQLRRDRTRCPRRPASPGTTRARQAQAGAAGTPRHVRRAAYTRPRGQPRAPRRRARCRGTSRWRRFLTRFASGTRWKNSRGPPVGRRTRTPNPEGEGT